TVGPSRREVVHGDIASRKVGATPLKPLAWRRLRATCRTFAMPLDGPDRMPLPDAENRAAYRFAWWRCWRDPAFPERLANPVPIAVCDWQSRGAGRVDAHGRRCRPGAPSAQAATARHAAKSFCRPGRRTGP